MHRATPLNSSFRAFSGGGTRSAIDTIDDSKLMQEMAGNFMNGESRKGVEAPQNYGFTSVVMPAIKDALGKIIDRRAGDWRDLVRWAETDRSRSQGRRTTGAIG